MCIFKRTVFDYKICRRLFANSRQARYIIRGIAHHCLEVYYFLRLYLINFFNMRGRKCLVCRYAFACFRKYLRYIFIYKLQKIAVAGKNRHIHAVFDSICRLRAYDVVCLKPFFLKYSHIHGFKCFFNKRHLSDKLIGHFLSRSLVLGIHFMSECRRR